MLLISIGDGGAEATLTEAQALLANCDRPLLLALLPKTLAMLHYMQGRQAETGRQNARALKLARAGGYEILAITIEENIADSLWLAGDLPGALAATRNVIEQCKRVKAAHKVNWGWIYGNYLGMLVETGELAEAAGIARLAMPCLREANSTRRVMDHFALRLAKAGRPEEAAVVHGWINDHFTSKRITRQPNELRAMNSTASLLRDQLSPGVLARLLADGAQLTEQEVCRVALA